MRIFVYLVLAASLLVSDQALAWSRRHALRVNEEHRRALQAPVLDPFTKRTLVQRQGNTVNTQYGPIWCQLPIYDGPAYVIIPTPIGATVVEIDHAGYGSIYKGLVSDDNARVVEAFLLVQGSAFMQGLIKLPPSFGD